jgi:hypothetical protein
MGIRDICNGNKNIPQAVYMHYTTNLYLKNFSSTMQNKIYPPPKIKLKKPTNE